MSNLRWVTGATTLACTGALMACQAGTPVGSPASTESTTSSAATPTPTATATPSTAAPSPSAGSTDPVLSGKREVTIVRVQSFESGLSLDGELREADDDSGRQLFVPTPLGGNNYQIKAYGKADNHPANDEPSCWQVKNPGNAQSLTVVGAGCAADNPAQRFTIIAEGEGAYAISNSSAYLQHSPSKGMILEELGDAPLRSTFRFVDNGPARRPAGG